MGNSWDLAYTYVSRYRILPTADRRGKINARGRL